MTHNRIKKGFFDMTFCIVSIGYILLLTMLSTLPVEMDEEKDLESVQKDQKKVGKAGSNPETSGPAEELREKAADMTDESEDSKEPA
jgi:hypothetical protein